MSHCNPFIVAPLLACLFASGVLARGAEPPRYVLTNLGTLGTSSIAYDINNHSQIVGWSDTNMQTKTPFGTPVNIERAIRWEDGIMTALPPLPTAQPYSSSAHAISDAGHIVGTSMALMFFSSPPVMWFNGSVTGLESPAEFGEATGVNSDGVAVGTCRSDTVGSAHACRWSLQSGLTILLEPSQNTDAFAYDIDSRGRVVGAGPGYGAYLWERGVFTPLTKDRTWSRAQAINEKGEIVGATWMPGSPTQLFLWRDGILINVATFGGGYAEAFDINDNSWVVGSSWLAGATKDRALLWVEGHTYDLNDLIPANSGMELETAYAINNKNEIVGQGQLPTGQRRAFLLTPIGPGDVDADGDVDVDDLLAVIASWGSCPPAPAQCPADLAPRGGDGVVNVDDLLTVLVNWG